MGVGKAFFAELAKVAEEKVPSTPFALFTVIDLQS